MRSLHLLSLVALSSLALVPVAACGDGAAEATSSGAGGGPTSGAGGSGGGGGSLPVVCNEGTRWAPGTSAFREATAEWGLPETGAEGVLLSAVDFDSDGWTDLAVRRVGNAQDDFAPGGVRQTWLLRNTGAGRFEDVTESSRIRETRYGTDPSLGRPGVVFAFADVDNDGDLDVFTGLLNKLVDPYEETSEVLLQQPDGTFELGPEDSELRVAAPDIDSVAGASFVDFDRDGFVDLWVTQNSVDYEPQQDHLYRGDGTGRFTRVTDALGLDTLPWASISNLNTAKSHSNAWSAAACDLNGDGDLELLAASYGRAPNHLWQAQGTGAFVNRSVDSGYAFDHRTDWTDNESARCWCTLHPTDEDCAGVPEPENIGCQTDEDAFRWQHGYDREPFRLGGNSGATICSDIDNDGDIDLITTEIVHWDVGSSSDPSELLLNSGEPDVRFERPGNEVTGLVRDHVGVDWNEGIISGSAFDFDNDGWADIYLGNTDYPDNYGLLYHQESPARFVPVPITEGIDHHRSHGSAIADFDRDGDLDVVVGHSLARCESDCYDTGAIRFFENTFAQAGNFVSLRLTGGAGTNRLAVGARVTVTAGGFTQTREVDGGHGHYGAQNDAALHFGLGTACTAEVTVRWPDAALTTQSFSLAGGYRYELTQGGEPAADLD